MDIKYITLGFRPGVSVLVVCRNNRLVLLGIHIKCCVINASSWDLQQEAYIAFGRPSLAKSECAERWS